MGPLRPSFSCLKNCTVAAHYPHFSTLHTVIRLLSKDKRYLPNWKISRLPFEPSPQLNKFQCSKLTFFSHAFTIMDNREKDIDTTCNLISVSPTRRHPRESQPMSTRAKGKDKDFRYDEKDGDEGGFSGRKRMGRGKVKGDKINALGRLMTTILRHRAEKLGLNIRPDGYVPIDQLLQLKIKTFSGIPLCSHTIDDVQEAVKNDNKQRFSMREENGQLYIRANQGHTVMVVESDELLKPISSAEEIPVCVHGTYRKNLESIFKTGLSRMKRCHVHFATGLPHDNDVVSGADEGGENIAKQDLRNGAPKRSIDRPLGIRGNIEILIYLDVEKALKDGMKLYLSDNKVLLTEGFNGVVPPKYFKKVETWPEGKPVTLPEHVKFD